MSNFKSVFVSRFLEPGLRSIVPFMKTRFCITIALIALAGALLTTDASADVYVNAATGNDNNDGSESSPWATLQKARASVTAPETVIVADGYYGEYFETTPKGNTDYIRFSAAPGAKPLVGGINIDYSTKSSAYVIFDGFEVYSDDRVDLVMIDDASYVRIINCEIHADRWARGPNTPVDGIVVDNSSDVLIEQTRIYEVMRPIQVGNSTDVTIRRNYLTAKGGTGVQWIGGNRQGVIEYNRITSESYTPYPEDPLAFDDPHASIISIRSSELTIRGNILHGMGTSSGMMMYSPDAAGGEDVYRDIIIENNAMYDIENPYGLRIFNLGENIVLRNNLFYSHIRGGDCSGTTNDARYRYQTALNIESLAVGYDGSGLALYNNIFIGISNLPSTVVERNNIYWALNVGGWTSTTPSGTSLVMVDSYMGCGNHPLLFEDGSFFADVINLWFPQNDPADFTLSKDSLGYNFGAAEFQAPYSLGSIGPDGFIMDNGVERSDSIKSVGPFEEFGSRPQAPTNLDVQVSTAE